MLACSLASKCVHVNEYFVMAQKVGRKFSLDSSVWVWMFLLSWIFAFLFFILSKVDITTHLLRLTVSPEEHHSEDQMCSMLLFVASVCCLLQRSLLLPRHCRQTTGLIGWAQAQGESQHTQLVFKVFPQGLWSWFNFSFHTIQTNSDVRLDS